MVKSALRISRRHFADDDSLLAHAMKTRLIVAFLLMWFALPAHAEGIVTGVTSPAAGWESVNLQCEAMSGCSRSTYCLYVNPFNYVGGYAQSGYCRGNGNTYTIGTAHAQILCPAHSTGTTSCVCDSGYIPDAAATSCIVAPPPDCTVKIGIVSPHLVGDGTVVPSSACFDSCLVNIDIGAAGSTFWVGWGQFTGASCVGQTAASAAPAPGPDVCPAGRAIYNGVCTPLVDIPELGYGGMSISDIQNAIAKSEAAAASKKAAAEKLVTPVYTSPDSIPSAPSIQNVDKTKAVEDSGTGGRVSARDQGGSGDTQIISGELGAGFGSIVTTLKDIFGGNVAGASVNGAQIDLIVQPTTKEIAVTSLTPVAVAHAQAVCPSTNITLQGHPAVWTYTTECNFATGIRPILLAFAWLSAAFILVGGVKNG